MDATYPYLKSEQVFLCPSDPDGTKYKYTYYKNLTAPSDQHYGSYGLNIMYRYDTSPNIRQPPSGSNGSGLSLASLQDPSGTVWAGDVISGQDSMVFGWQCLTSCSNNQPSPIITTTNNQQNIGGLAARHLNTANLLYTDGHVKAEHLDSLVNRRTSDGTLAAFTVQNDG